MAHSPLRADQVDDLIFYAAIGVVLGGRLGYALLYGFDRLAADPLWLLRVWEGGMAFHGGFLGVLMAMAVFARQRGIAWGQLMDFVALLTPVGLALGRLGNFIGQELWGRATDAPWAMIFPNDPLALPPAPFSALSVCAGGMCTVSGVAMVQSSASTRLVSVRTLFDRLWCDAFLGGIFSRTRCAHWL